MQGCRHILDGPDEGLVLFKIVNKFCKTVYSVPVKHLVLLQMFSTCVVHIMSAEMRTPRYR